MSVASIGYLPGRFAASVNYPILATSTSVNNCYILRPTLPAPRHDAVHCLFNACECSAVHTCEQWLFWSLYVSRELPTYPSPKPTFCSQWEVSVNVGLYSCQFMSIVAGQYMLLLLLCFSSCFTIIIFWDDDLYLYISIFGTAPCILPLNSDLLTAKNCSFYFSAIFNKDTTGI